MVHVQKNYKNLPSSLLLGINGLIIHFICIPLTFHYQSGTNVPTLGLSHQVIIRVCVNLGSYRIVPIHIFELLWIKPLDSFLEGAKKKF